MRTNIEIDDALMTEAMEASGAATKKATVDAALRAFVENIRRRNAIEAMRGTGWIGDLGQMREDQDVDQGS